MLYITCTTITSVDLAHYGVSRAKDRVSVDCGTNYVIAPLLYQQGWPGGAMVLGKLPVPMRPTIWMIVGQGPIALAVDVCVWGGGGGVVVWTF